MRFGIQLYPPKSAPEMAAFAKKALARYSFDKVWVPDHLTYENVFVILAAIISETSARAGTSVVQPFSRTPLDLASSFAALAHLAGDRGVTVGIGAGAPSSDMIHKRNRVGMTRETILFLRAMFAGEKVALGEFPALADFFRLDPSAEAFLRLPPAKVPDIFVAAAGRQMLKLAWQIGDGLIVSNLSFPTALVRLGALDAAMTELEAARDGEATIPTLPKCSLACVGFARRSGGETVRQTHGCRRSDPGALAETANAQVASAKQNRRRRAHRP